MMRLGEHKFWVREDHWPILGMEYLPYSSPEDAALFVSCDPPLVHFKRRPDEIYEITSFSEADALLISRFRILWAVEFDSPNGNPDPDIVRDYIVRVELLNDPVGAFSD